jgi:hypothetical protein
VGGGTFLHRQGSRKRSVLACLWRCLLPLHGVKPIALYLFTCLQCFYSSLDLIPEPYMAKSKCLLHSNQLGPASISHRTAGCEGSGHTVLMQCVLCPACGDAPQVSDSEETS